MSPNETYPPCAARMQLIEFAKSGKQTKVQRCGEARAAKANQNVAPEDCDECLVRVEITKIALARHEYKPPLFTTLRQVVKTKKDTKSADGWPPCPHRNLVTALGCCGQPQEHRVCDSIDCFRIGSEVTPIICGGCIYRES